MMKDCCKAVNLFSLKDFEFQELEGHEGGRNQIFICSKNDEKKFVLRISSTGDKTEKDYLAETEFVHYLAEHGAPVADVIQSVNGKLVEVVDDDAASAFISLFEYAKGMLLCDNGYHYREGEEVDYEDIESAVSHLLN